MVPLDAWFSPLAFGLALLAALTLLVMRAIGKDRRDYQRFRRTRSTEGRQRFYRKWLWQSFLLHGGLTIMLLVLSWQAAGLALAEGRLIEPVPLIVQTARGSDTGLAGSILFGVALLLAAALLLPLFFLRRSLRSQGGIENLPSIGDIGSLIPRTPAELRYGALLSLNAGLTEELLFRLAIPATFYGFTGDALASFVLSAGIFGLVHTYQKWLGVLMATVVGLIFTLLYLATGSILWPIIAHALFNLRSLVLVPLLLQPWKPVDSPDTGKPVEAATPGQVADSTMSRQPGVSAPSTEDNSGRTA